MAKLLEGLPIDVDAMEEGEVFLTDPELAMYEPVMRISGKYGLCQVRKSHSWVPVSIQRHLHEICESGTGCARQDWHELRHEARSSLVGSHD